MIPDHLLQDRYWRGLLHIFMNHNKLKQLLSKPEFVDFEELTVHVDELIKASKSWSPSERFMLTCALHLFNGINTIDIPQADRLDDKNTEILREALLLRLAR
ncbi:hypothetical protein MHB77_29310 [Paenibacillus sp. FSL K6-3166]|uniref:hypothetical protein n=1 Tax=unclassified Paenibacillus TaxID=185978 RepID=UPI000BA0FCAE|nr:hypothetical protein [Paenibacillus sp. VTT E-133291]OZQ95825.1 hypothetical protein CA598_08325 [Paenibacillus sp. VTT E-133291]